MHQAGKFARWFAHKTFNFWQALGLHVTPNHFYDPVPDTRQLGERLWKTRNSIAGVNLNEDAQVNLLEKLRTFSKEFMDFPETSDNPESYSRTNPSLGLIDAFIYYGLVREHKPKRIIEIGGGYSSLLAGAALQRNSTEGSTGRLDIIEPYPQEWLRSTPMISSLIESPVQDVPLETFSMLEGGDMLFIDSSHVLKIGSDVDFELRGILPMLRPGVMVHVHDIFLPEEYPRDWVLNQKRFWNEQQALQLFLMYNEKFAVHWAGNYMRLRHPDKLKAVMPTFDAQQERPGSFWLLSC